MLDFTREFKDTINKRISISIILDVILHHSYEPIISGDFVRINPSPISGKSNNSFSIGKFKNGIEFYKLFSESTDYQQFKDLPETGTAADIIACLCNTYNDVYSLIQCNKRLVLEPKEYIKPELISNSEVEEIYKNTLNNMTRIKLDYYKTIRDFDIETIKHFKIGFNKSIYLNNKWYSYYSFPYFGKDYKLNHIKFKLIEPDAPKEIKTCQIKNNSGGEWLFNEVDLYTKDVVFICEGEHDAMRIWEQFTCTRPNFGVIALGGNPSLSKIKKIKDANKKYILAFDNDDQGFKYTQKFKSIFPNSIVVIGDDKDPDDWFKYKNVRLV